MTVFGAREIDWRREGESRPRYMSRGEWIHPSKGSVPEMFKGYELIDKSWTSPVFVSVVGTG